MTKNTPPPPSKKKKTTQQQKHKKFVKMINPITSVSQGVWPDNCIKANLLVFNTYSKLVSSSPTGENIVH